MHFLSAEFLGSDKGTTIVNTVVKIYIYGVATPPRSHLRPPPRISLGTTAFSTSNVCVSIPYTKYQIAYIHYTKIVKDIKYLQLFV